MQGQYVGTIQWDRRPISSHIPCEGCGFRRSTVKLTLPIGGGVTHRFCDKCDPKQ